MIVSREKTRNEVGNYEMRFKCYRERDRRRERKGKDLCLLCVIQCLISKWFFLWGFNLLVVWVLREESVLMC